MNFFFDETRVIWKILWNGHGLGCIIIWFDCRIMMLLGAQSCDGDTIILLMHNHIVETDGRPSLRGHPSNPCVITNPSICTWHLYPPRWYFLRITMDIKIKKRLNYRNTDPKPENAGGIYALGCLAHDQVVDCMIVVDGGQSCFGDTIMLLVHNHIICAQSFCRDGRPSVSTDRSYLRGRPQ